MTIAWLMTQWPDRARPRWRRVGDSTEHANRRINIDAVAKTIDVNITADELEKRRKEWKPRELKFKRGVLYR